MNAEFLVDACFELSGLGVVVSGEVKSGEIQEGAVGRTAKGKKCVVVRIENMGERVPVAREKAKVSLTIKHVMKNDIKPWDMVYFE